MTATSFILVFICGGPLSKGYFVQTRPCSILGGGGGGLSGRELFKNCTELNIRQKSISQREITWLSE